MAITADAVESIERLTANQQVASDVDILNGETSVAEAARTQGLPMAEVVEWSEQFLLGAEKALHSRLRNDRAFQGRADHEGEAENREPGP